MLPAEWCQISMKLSICFWLCLVKINSVLTWKQFTMNLLLQNNWTNFYLWHQLFLGKESSSLFKSRITIFSKWRWSTLMNFKGQFQPNLVQLKHPWVKGIQVSTNDGPHPFRRGVNYERKIHKRKIKMFFSRTTLPISTKLGTKCPLVKRAQEFTNIEHSILEKEIMEVWFFLLLIKVMI